MCFYSINKQLLINYSQLIRKVPLHKELFLFKHHFNTKWNSLCRRLSLIHAVWRHEGADRMATDEGGGETVDAVSLRLLRAAVCHEWLYSCLQSHLPHLVQYQRLGVSPSTSLSVPQHHLQCCKWLHCFNSTSVTVMTTAGLKQRSQVRVDAISYCSSYNFHC